MIRVFIMSFWKEYEVACKFRLAVQRPYTLQCIPKIDVVPYIINDHFSALKLGPLVGDFGVNDAVELLGGAVRKP